jgi:hypothetical protein
MPVVSGILSIITGGLSLLAGIAFALGMVFYLTPQYGFYPDEMQVPVILAWVIIFVPLLVLSVLAIIGGIFAIKRRLWGLALAGAICALLTMWAWPLGMASIILTALSKSEFDHYTPNVSSTLNPPPNYSSPLS